MTLACGDNESRISLTVLGSPEFLAYQRGSGEWVQPTPFSSTNHKQMYALETADEIKIVLVCAKTDGTSVAQELFATRDDVDLMLGSIINAWPDQACVSSIRPVPVQIEGAMNESGFVVVDALEESGSGSWSFSFSTFPGIKDLVGIGNGRVIIHHDVSALSAMSTVDLDLAADGSNFSMANMEVRGAAANELSESTFLATKNGTLVSSFAQPPKFGIVPAAQLADEDLQWLTIATIEAPGPQQVSRSAWVKVSDQTPGSIVLLPRITGVSYETDNVAASWDALSMYTNTYLEYTDTLRGRQTLTVTKHWLDDHGGAIRFDTDIPGYRTEWNVAPTSSSHLFEVDNRTVDVYLTAAVSDTVQLDALRRIRNSVRSASNRRSED